MQEGGSHGRQLQHAAPAAFWHSSTLMHQQRELKATSLTSVREEVGLPRLASLGMEAAAATAVAPDSPAGKETQAGQGPSLWPVPRSPCAQSGQVGWACHSEQRLQGVAERLHQPHLM